MIVHPRGHRRLLATAVIALTLATLSTGLAGPAAAAPAVTAAECGYRDYGTFPADPYLWISARRATAPTGQCVAYVVVRNTKATGRKDCIWQLVRNDQVVVQTGTCPKAGESVASYGFPVSGGQLYEGRLSFTTVDGWHAFTRTLFFPN